MKNINKKKNKNKQEIGKDKNTMQRPNMPRKRQVLQIIDPDTNQDIRDQICKPYVRAARNKTSSHDTSQVDTQSPTGTPQTDSSDSGAKKSVRGRARVRRRNMPAALSTDTKQGQPQLSLQPVICIETPEAASSISSSDAVEMSSLEPTSDATTANNSVQQALAPTTALSPSDTPQTGSSDSGAKKSVRERRAKGRRRNMTAASNTATKQEQPSTSSSQAGVMSPLEPTSDATKVESTNNISDSSNDNQTRSTKSTTPDATTVNNSAQEALAPAPAAKVESTNNISDSSNDNQTRSTKSATPDATTVNNSAQEALAPAPAAKVESTNNISDSSNDNQTRSTKSVTPDATTVNNSAQEALAPAPAPKVESTNNISDSSNDNQTRSTKSVTPDATTINNSAQEALAPAPAAKVESTNNISDSSNDNQTRSTKSAVVLHPTLKYVYEPDQWSPLNPEGKKIYDRSFLLNLRYANESTLKPEGLVHFPDIALDAPIRRDDFGLGADIMRDFAPVYAQPLNKCSLREGTGIWQQKHCGSPPGYEGQQRKVINIPLQRNVKLHRTENAWAPVHKMKQNMDEEQAKNEDLYKAFTGILNKLTPQKFDTLADQALKLEISTEEQLKGCIDRIFEKAIDEPNFSVTYAKMAECMTVFKVPSEMDPSKNVLFRSLLLHRCQHEFEKEKANEKDMERLQKEMNAAETEEDKKHIKEEMDLKLYNDKRRSLGNIRFIGELFKLQIIAEKVMHNCVAHLLKSTDEENLECLCRLMTTIGKDIDQPKNKQRVDAHFIKLDNIVKAKSTSSRVRFMIQDLSDLRANKWVPRREEGPKTIDAIHKEAEHEEQERQKLVQRLNEQQHLPTPGRSALPGRHGRQQWTTPVNEDGRHSVGGCKAGRIDPTKMKFTQQFNESTITLRPQGGKKHPMWALGSRAGGPSREMRKPESSNAPTNKQHIDMAPRGRGDACKSVDQEKEGALFTVRNIASGGPRSCNQGRESSRDGRQCQSRSESQETRRSSQYNTSAVAAAPPPAEKKKAQKPEEVERKTKSLLEEYLHLHDLNEAIACVQEIDPTHMHLFVMTILNSVLERTQQGRQLVGNLLHDLVKKKVLTVDQYLQGLLDVLEFAEDIEIDIPRIWLYLGQVIGPMVQDGSVPLNFLRSAVRPLSPQKVGQLLREVVHDAAARLGHLKVGEMWRYSGLSWQELLGSDQNLDNFIKNNNLEFTLGTQERES